MKPFKHTSPNYSGRKPLQVLNLPKALTNTYSIRVRRSPASPVLVASANTDVVTPLSRIATRLKSWYPTGSDPLTS